MLEVLKFVGSLGGSGEAAGGGQRAGKVEVQSLARGASARVIQITANLFRIDPVIVRQHVGVGHVQDLQTEEPCLLLGVGEGRVGEADEPVIVVVDGVVHAEGAVGPDVR